MARDSSSEELRQALPLLEEAVTLLRRTPPRAWACYVMGTGPFVLGVVWFWSAMSNLPSAQAPAIVWALPLAALHLWMRVWQSRFAVYLFEQRSGREPSRWRADEWLRAAVNQLRYGTPAFLALLPALLAAVPFGWVYAYYHTLAVTAHQPGASSRAWKAARSAPYQNHATISWFFLCCTVAFVNIASIVWLAPRFIKFFIPVDWAFTRYPFWLLSSTAICVIVALTYLVTDPLAKAIYALRAFYGLSRTSGEDLLVDWRRLTATAGVALALLLCMAPLRAAHADVPVAVPAEAFADQSDALPPDALAAQIDRALLHPRYNWRMPAPPSESDSWLTRQIRRLTDPIVRWTRSALDAIDRFFEKIGDLFRRRDSRSFDKPSSFSADKLTKVFTVALIVTAACLFILLWRSRRRGPPIPVAEAAAALPQATPDVADESVTPDALPDDEWLLLANQLREDREYRKAARALFLGLLACLARRDLLSLRASKTTADYLRELRRRTAGAGFDEAPFRQTTRLFEAGWYGDHPVTDETLDTMTGDVETYRHG